MDDIYRTIEPDNSLKKGYLVQFGDIFHEIRQNKWLTYQLFKRDVLALYKQSFIGIFWAFIVPLISVGTFILLNSSGVFSVGEINLPYPLYALLGMSFWQIFAVGLVACSNSLVKAGSMIIRINFSKKSLVFASFGQSCIPFLVQFGLVILLFFVYGSKPSWAILLTPLLAILIILFTLGLGFLFSIFNGIMRDIGTTLSFLITFLMFLTPVFYVKPETGFLSNLTEYNPLHYLISVPRDLILTGTTTESTGYFISAIVSLFFFLVCLLFFHLTETRVTERI